MPPTTSNPIDLLGHATIPSIVELDVLLPNGLLINLEFSRETTLDEIRQKVWTEALNHSKLNPSLNLKQSINDYIFTSVGQDAKKIEYYDYSKRLCELKLFFGFFKLIEVYGNLDEKSFNSDLSKAIGLYINEIEQIKDEEFIDFRLELFKEIKRNINSTQGNQIKNKDELELDKDEDLNVIRFIESAYLPYLEIDPNLLDFNIVSSKLNSINLNDVKIDINIHITEQDQPEITYHLNIPLSYTPTDIITYIIKTKLKNLKQTDNQINSIIEKYKDAYMLNVCGCDEIFYGNKYKIGSYKYIKRCLSTGRKAHFHLISFEKLKSKISSVDNVRLIDKYILVQEDILNKKIKDFKDEQIKVDEKLSWDMNETFNMYLENLIYVPFIKDCEKIYLKIELYHGQELKYKIESDKFNYEKVSGKDSSLKLSQYIAFDYKIRKLHRCDKICISLNCVSKRKREFFSIGWISLNLFDYKGKLISGPKKLYLWQGTQESYSNQCSVDVTGQNPEKDYVRLYVEFLKNKPSNMVILYPNKEQIKTLISKSTSNSQDECIDVSYALENDNSLLESILNKDALAELTEQEKNVLWRRREDCINYPHSLPKLLQSVKWSNQAEVVEIYNLLFKWPMIKPIQALELLLTIHADLEIRNFACKCLDSFMKDEEVQHYLLQLVQCLKHEPYYDNSLTRFLLRRALKSQRIGFDLFWNLKSEMKNSRYKYRFGLILEAYCRGINNLQLKDLLKQVDMVEKLSSLAQEIKSNPDNLTLIKSSFLKDKLNKSHYKTSLSSLLSPLNRSHVLGTIEPSKCKILASAKRPLFLTWKNNLEYSELYYETFELIFKHGDDLRQDMLTLQILKLMDILWKSEGLDLKMLIYDCLSTGSKIGFIEVIKNSMTLFKIQMEGGMRGRYQIDTLQLFKWLSLNNPNSDQLNKAIDCFTKSCAGFCVATFILGIGDRHPDNIMLNKEGQLFHIDFGHFLGHFKKKYGIKRERVPFVLTEDFTKVISKGALNASETEEFNNFRLLCENAYMIVRRYSHLIINLFALMLSSDMPELQSIEDIMYLRKTLAIDETDDKALEYFRNQFNEAYKLSYTTKLDWMCHALNKKI